jgi:predicted phosphodiesterase
MRVALISDMHGNAYGFETALADLNTQHVDQIVCLGDAIQGGPQPAETTPRLHELNCPVVMGNADAWMLTSEDSGAEGKPSEKQLAVREWSLSQLSEADKAFIGGFQQTVEIDMGGGKKLLCFHGSPTSFDHVILPTTPEEEFQRYLGAYDPAILTGGHTHMQQIRRLGSGETFYFNPGSVGFAYSHQQPDDDFRADAWAEYAILTHADERLSLEFRRIPYDGQKMIDIYLNSGRPYKEEAAGQYQPR